MSDEEFENPFLMSIGLMISYRCNIACPHCIVKAGPKRTERMTSSFALPLIDEIRNYNDGIVKCIALTGGEPFYEIDLMRSIARRAHDSGIAVSCVTNAFWATSVEEAVKTLSSLPGLKMVSVSTDFYHQRFIPLTFISNARRACEKLDLAYTIAVCHEDKHDPEFISMLDDLKNIVPESSIKFSRALPFGRMENRSSTLNYPSSPDPSEGACSMASYPVIFPQGKVVACIGPIITLQPPHPLILGDLTNDTLTNILDNAESNAILHAIRIWGPSRLLDWLHRIGYKKDSPDMFMDHSICDACYTITTDPYYAEGLAALLEHREFVEEVAWGRVYHLHEEQMAAALQE